MAMASRQPAADFVEGARSLEDWRRDFEVCESSAETVYADFKAWRRDSGVSGRFAMSWVKSASIRDENRSSF